MSYAAAFGWVETPFRDRLSVLFSSVLLLGSIVIYDLQAVTAERFYALPLENEERCAVNIAYLQERQLASLDRAQLETDSCARSAHIGMARLFASMIDRLKGERDYPLRRS